MSVRFRLALLLACLLPPACGSSAPLPEVTSPIPQADPDAILALPGYRADQVDETIFGGQAFIMEVGPTDGPAVVLVHGLGENGARDWHSVLPALATRYHVVAFDLPGFARSTHGYSLYSPERYTQFIHDVVAARVKKPFNLAGHSLGGAVALLYAARFPQDVERLVLIDVAGILHRESYANFAMAAGLGTILGRLGSSGNGPVKVIADAMSPVSQPVLQTSPDPGFLLQSELLRKKILGRPSAIAALALILHNYAPVIAAVRSPTWILWGQNDAIASPRVAHVLRARLQHAELHILENSGHDPMVTEPDLVAGFLMERFAAAPPSHENRSLPAMPMSISRKGRCDHQQGTRFSGDYLGIEIVACQGVSLKDVRATYVVISGSDVNMENVQVVGRDKGVQLVNSEAEITASEFQGDIALEVENSTLDLAGVNLRGHRAAVHALSASRLIFSVSQVSSPVAQGYLHEVVDLGKGADL